MRIRALYNPPQGGSHLVIGRVTGIKYGMGQKGRVMTVEIADAVAAGSNFLCPDTGAQFKIEGDNVTCPEWEGLSAAEIVVSGSAGAVSIGTSPRVRSAQGDDSNGGVVTRAQKNQQVMDALSPYQRRKERIIAQSKQAVLDARNAEGEAVEVTIESDDTSYLDPDSITPIDLSKVDRSLVDEWIEDLMTIPGIGEATAVRLISAGYNSVQKLESVSIQEWINNVPAQVHGKIFSHFGVQQ